MGLAFTRDGKRMEYSEYISKHPYWKKVRQARFEFDGGRCVICHKDLTGEPFETHHLTYLNLGHEHLTDVITLCPKHHTIFHNNWAKQQYWKGKEAGHWEVFNLDHTAKLCQQIWRNDKYICKDISAPNYCNKNLQREEVHKYIIKVGDNSIRIDPNDIGLFVRNKRYELFFDAEFRGLTVEQFLDEYYGIKERGKNPMRQEAGKLGGTFDHKPESFHLHYYENPNLNRLMEKVQELEKEIINNEET